jgi:hypothetical protein
VTTDRCSAADERPAGLPLSVAPIALTALGGGRRVLALVGRGAPACVDLIGGESTAFVSSDVALVGACIDQFALLGWHGDLR